MGSTSLRWLALIVMATALASAHDGRLAIGQEIRDTGVKLSFGGRGPARPTTVTNIVSWPLGVGIKGKTLLGKYKNRYNQLDYRGTNSHQGRFELSSTEAGARPMTAPR